MGSNHRPGILIGPVLIDDGERRDLSNEIWASSPDTSFNKLKIENRGARLILLVENRRIFDRLVEDRFHRSNSCVLATGDGYPSRQFRKMLRDLHKHLQVPLYVLADNDPAAYSFYFLIARGSLKRTTAMNLAMAIPTARYLGIRAQDFMRFGMHESVKIELRRDEVDELARLRSASWLSKAAEWQREFEQMRQNGFKLEMEAFCTLGLSFLAETYLPEKIAAEQYLKWDQ